MRGKWISIKDRYPEDNETVLVCSEHLEDILPEICYFDEADKLFFSVRGYRRYPYVVTHWLPLPPTLNADRDKC